MLASLALDLLARRPSPASVRAIGYISADSVAQGKAAGIAGADIVGYAVIFGRTVVALQSLRTATVRHYQVIWRKGRPVLQWLALPPNEAMEAERAMARAAAGGF